MAVLWNERNPAKLPDYCETETAARALGLRLQSLPVHEVDEFEPAIATARGQGADALATANVVIP